MWKSIKVQSNHDTFSRTRHPNVTNYSMIPERSRITPKPSSTFPKIVCCREKRLQFVSFKCFLCSCDAPVCWPARYQSDRLVRPVSDWPADWCITRLTKNPPKRQHWCSSPTGFWINEKKKRFFERISTKQVKIFFAQLLSFDFSRLIHLLLKMCVDVSLEQLTHWVSLRHCLQHVFSFLRVFFLLHHRR